MSTVYGVRLVAFVFSNLRVRFFLFLEEALTPVKGDRLFAYKTLLHTHEQEQCKLHPVINIHASAWVAKEEKEAKLLNTKKKKKTTQVTLKRKSGKLHSDKTISFLFIFLLS